MQRVIKSLENGTYRKIICGAANTSERQIERMSLIYSLCGADVIDIAPQKGMYDAAKRGIVRATEIAAKSPDIYPKFNAAAVMKSINVGDDRHFRKASFNLANCMQCLECVKVCQAGALTVVDGKQAYNSKKCYGCAMCVESCQHNAVSMVRVFNNSFDRYSQSKDSHFASTRRALPAQVGSISNPLTSTENEASDFPGQFEAIEVHTGNHSIEEVKAFIELHKNIIGRAGIISVSVETTRFNSAQLVEYVNALVKMFESKIIIQADGIAMRGGGKPSSTLPSLAAASVLVDAKVDAYIQLSGGTNHLTQKFVDMAELKIGGIGYGTFAKKTILSYIEEYSEEEFIVNLPKIADIAGKLINP
jgi:Fe-S-cluster-containing hydrogenase component 2